MYIGIVRVSVRGVSRRLRAKSTPWVPAKSHSGPPGPATRPLCARLVCHEPQGALHLLSARLAQSRPCRSEGRQHALFSPPLLIVAISICAAPYETAAQPLELTIQRAECWPTGSPKQFHHYVPLHGVYGFGNTTVAGLEALFPMEWDGNSRQSVLVGVRPPGMIIEFDKAVRTHVAAWGVVSVVPPELLEEPQVVQSLSIRWPPLQPWGSGQVQLWFGPE